MKKLPYNFNKKLGYYKIDGCEYEYKIEALLDASMNQSSSYLEFDFNNEFFAKVKWKEEPSETLDQLYAERARQVREKYDYVIIAYSGGSDSWTMLNAFLSNGIKVDEIVTLVPEEAVKNKNPSNIDYSPYNFWSEYHYVTKPDLEQIAKEYPEIKITVHDWSIKGDKVDLDGDWIIRRSGPTTTTYNNRWKLENITDAEWKYKKIGYLVGHDKPRICFKDKKFYLYFLDFINHSVTDSDSYYNDISTTEFFYWAPESEKILRKQAHIIKRFFEHNRQLIPYISWPIANPNNRNFYENVVKSLIYKDYDLMRFQVNKPDSSLWTGFDYVLYDVVPDLFKYWQGKKNDLLPLIQSKYISNNEVKTFISGFYEL